MLKDRIAAEFNRMIVNLLPCIRGGGGRVIFVSTDYTRLVVKLPLTWKTKNAMGTIYGGSMYASTDPFFMIMLMKILGKDFVVWDKGCTIRFKRPAKTTLFAEFLITPEMLSEVKASVSANHECTFTWTISYKDQEGVVYSEFDKVLYVAKKDFYLEKQKRRSESKKLP